LAVEILLERIAARDQEPIPRRELRSKFRIVERESTAIAP
jgi:hypothetical protein